MSSRNGERLCGGTAVNEGDDRGTEGSKGGATVVVVVDGRRGARKVALVLWATASAKSVLTISVGGMRGWALATASKKSMKDVKGNRASW